MLAVNIYITLCAAFRASSPSYRSFRQKIFRWTNWGLLHLNLNFYFYNFQNYTLTFHGKRSKVKEQTIADMLWSYGGVAQLGERTVRIRKVESSILFVSTNFKTHCNCWKLQCVFLF